MKVRVETVERLEGEANLACKGEQSDREASLQRFTAQLASEAGKDPHICVGLLVDFLHKLDQPLLSPHAGDFGAFVASVKRPSLAQRLVAVRAALSRLPAGHLAIAKSVFSTLRDCIDSSSGGSKSAGLGELARSEAARGGEDDASLDEAQSARADAPQSEVRPSRGVLSSRAIAGVLAPIMLERVLIDAADVDHIDTRPDERFLASEVVRLLIEYCDAAFGRANEEDMEELLAQVADLQAGIEAERFKTRQRERELAQVEERRVVSARVALDRQMMRRVISAWGRTAQRSRGRMALHDRVRLLSELLDHQARIAAHKDRLLERLAAETGNTAMLTRLQEKGLLAPSAEQDPSTPGGTPSAAASGAGASAADASASVSAAATAMQESKQGEHGHGDFRGPAYRENAPAPLHGQPSSSSSSSTTRAVPSSYAAGRLSMPPMDSPVLRQQAARWQQQPPLPASEEAAGIAGSSSADAGKGRAASVEIDASRLPDAPQYNHASAAKSSAAAPQPQQRGPPRRAPEAAT